MAELHLKGYICADTDGIVASTYLSPEELKYSWTSTGTSIVESIENFASMYGMTGKTHKGLGGRVAYIEECNMRAYFTDKECELEEAMKAMDVLMYGGDIKTKVTYCGYSEWTITGMDLEEFSIGGHDLNSEFNSNRGRYCHLIVEC
jgi:hypothetical protein